MPKTANVPLRNPITRSGRALRLGGLLLIWLWLPSLSAAQTPRRCLAQSYDSLLRSRNPAYAQGRDLLNRLLLEPTASARTADAAEEETILIPVVVHVVHNNSTNQIGGSRNSNISDEQVSSQIAVLNEDYQRKEGTAGFNTNPVGANVNIKFELAKRDPQGGATNGIIRYYTTKSSYSINEMGQLSEIAYWPSNRYLNIWVTTITDPFIGYAQFPDMTGLPGLGSYNGLERTDGVIIDHRNFGRNTGTTTQGSYTQGRTTTHEVGHWLGLLHTWGDVECTTANCQCGDDFIEDTPPAQIPNETLTCPEIFSTCGGVRTRNMIENYMDYSVDRCMNIFTQGQKARIRRVLELSPRRQQLVEAARRVIPESDNLQVLLLSNNGARLKTGEEKIEIQLKGSQRVEVSVYSITGQLIKEIVLSTTPSTQVPLNLPAVPPGIYLVRVSTPTETQVQRLLLLE